VPDFSILWHRHECPATEVEFPLC